jgi:hypothetical protein
MPGTFTPPASVGPASKSGLGSRILIDIERRDLLPFYLCGPNPFIEQLSGQVHHIPQRPSLYGPARIRHRPIEYVLGEVSTLGPRYYNVDL